MVPEDVYELTGVADPRLSPDGTTVAYVVGAVDKDANEYRGGDLAGGGRRVGAAAPVHERRQGRRRPALVAGRHAAGVHLQPRRQGVAAVRDAGGRGRAAQAHEPQGRRDAGGLVARRHAHRLRRARARRRLRRRGRQEAPAAAPHAPAVQARQRGLDGRPAAAPLRRPGRRRRPSRCSSPTATTKTTRRRWSPDGATLAFVSARHPDWDLEMVTDVYLVDAAGGEPRRLTQGGGTVGGISWSPDGSRLAVDALPRRVRRPEAHPDRAGRRRPAATSRCSPPSLDRNCSTYPGMREPLWDGDGLVFVARGPRPHARLPRRRRRLRRAATRRRRRARRDRLRRGRRPARVHRRASRRG